MCCDVFEIKLALMLQNIPLISLNQRPDELKSQVQKIYLWITQDFQTLILFTKKLHIQLGQQTSTRTSWLLLSSHIWCGWTCTSIEKSHSKWIPSHAKGYASWIPFLLSNFSQLYMTFALICLPTTLASAFINDSGLKIIPTFGSRKESTKICRKEKK